MGRPHLDITGERYGRLVAIRFVGSNPRRLSLWRWQCDCGATPIILAANVRAGLTQSCGCLRREIFAGNQFARKVKKGQ